MSTTLPQRIAILGAGGQLGGEFQIRLPNAMALRRNDADLTDADSLRSVLTERQPQIVLNCAACNDVDGAELDPREVFAVNAFGVRNLAIICRELNIQLVHFSTDAVFGQDRERTTPLTELTVPGPVNAYGTSKLTGEHFVRGICRDFVVIRTCGLYGRRADGDAKNNCVESILSQAREGREVRVSNDQRCTPSSAEDIAAATLHILRAGLRGLFHLTNVGCCTWFEFAQTAIQIAGLHAPVVATTSDQSSLKAVRPQYSVLSADKYRAGRLPPIAPWQNALDRYVRS